MNDFLRLTLVSLLLVSLGCTSNQVVPAGVGDGDVGAAPEPEAGPDAGSDPEPEAEPAL